MQDDPKPDESDNTVSSATPLNTLFTDGAAADVQDDLPNTAHGSRKRARMACVQALYQWLVSGTEVGDLIGQFASGGRLARADREFFEAALRGATTDQSSLEATFDPHLSRPVTLLDPVEHAILLLAAWELRDRPEIPFAVVINEACDLARIYGAQDGYRFINGVLDATAKTLRKGEKRRR